MSYEMTLPYEIKCTEDFFYDEHYVFQVLSNPLQADYSRPYPVKPPSQMGLMNIIYFVITYQALFAAFNFRRFS